MVKSSATQLDKYISSSSTTSSLRYIDKMSSTKEGTYTCRADFSKLIVSYTLIRYVLYLYAMSYALNTLCLMNGT